MKILNPILEQKTLKRVIKTEGKEIVTYYDISSGAKIKTLTYEEKTGKLLNLQVFNKSYHFFVPFEGSFLEAFIYVTFDYSCQKTYCSLFCKNAIFNYEAQATAVCKKPDIFNATTGEDIVVKKAIGKFYSYYKKRLRQSERNFDNMIASLEKMFYFRCEKSYKIKNGDKYDKPKNN